MPILKGGLNFCSKYSATRFSVSTSRTLYGEVRNVVYGSDVQWRSRSYAASVPSEIPKSQKARKRLSRDERRAMMETFVSKYRAANEGKFPTLAVAHKHVGGSYYVVREILQELKYKSKISPSDIENEILLVRKRTQENESWPKAEVLSTAVARNQNASRKVAVNNVGTANASDKHLETGERLQTSTLVEKMSSKGVEEFTTLGGHSFHSELQDADKKQTIYEDLVDHDDPKQTDVVSDPCSTNTIDEKKQRTLCKDVLHSGGQKQKPEHYQRSLELESMPPTNQDNEKKEKTVSEDMLNSDGQERKAEQYQGSPEATKHSRDVSNGQADDAEPAKKSSLWDSLKSVADGIRNFWRKL